MMRAFKSPFLKALWAGLAATLLIAVIASLTAFAVIDEAVERSSKEDISREIDLLIDRNPDRNAIPDIASVTAAIGRRMFADADTDASSIYLLVDPDQRKIVGNVNRWPSVTTPNDTWIKTDGAELGSEDGPILLRTVVLSGGEFQLLVGRKLTAQKALHSRFIPMLVLSVLCLGLMLCALMLWLHTRYQRRVNAFNAVFSKISAGDVSARIAPSDLETFDELSLLGGNINQALEEVQRLMSSLDNYSKVAAHELNHAVSKMRDRFIASENLSAASDTEPLLELVSQILDLANIEAMPGYEMQKFDLTEAAQSVAALFEETFEDQEVVFQLDFPQTKKQILGSRPLVTSAILNLLSNAAKYAPRGSNVRLSVTPSDTHLTLGVHDMGEGLDTTDIAELAERAGEPDHPGHGFGLRHVQAVAIRHGARFTLKNTNPGLKAEIAFLLTADKA